MACINEEKHEHNILSNILAINLRNNEAVTSIADNELVDSSQPELFLFIRMPPSQNCCKKATIVHSELGIFIGNGERSTVC